MMKPLLAAGLVCALGVSRQAHADFFGGDLPLLAEIVANTLNTLNELRSQTEMLNKELRGIDDTIHRLTTIQEIIRTEDFGKWKDPREAVRRLSSIYYTLPPRLRTEKSDEIEQQIARAMSLASQLSDSAKAPFESGKQMESEALTSGPAVADKMTASGVGSLVALQSQNQVAQATIISLLSQMVAEGASNEATRLRTLSDNYTTTSTGIRPFSSHIKLTEIK
ncbi:MAG: hypothetical protein JST16_01110 [Bdellovibrionales bacterium]|nr:hypothetical protein [Bdellovibrionales bacterium]